MSSNNCNNFSWNPFSAIKKLASDLTLNVGSGISISKPITGPNDPLKDAFRNCSNCGKHYNFHKKQNGA